MSDPSSDTSTQLNNDLYADDNYSSTINFNATSGISNPSANVIKIFTNNIDALTIDENQFLTGNATGLTNLNYNAITNKPDLTVYAKVLYTEERQYPAKIWDTTEDITSITYNGFTAHNINFNITTAQYSNGFSFDPCLK